MNIGIFKTKWLARFARRERIADESLREAIDRAERGLVDAELVFCYAFDPYWRTFDTERACRVWKKRAELQVAKRVLLPYICALTSHRKTHYCRRRKPVCLKRVM